MNAQVYKTAECRVLPNGEAERPGLGRRLKGRDSLDDRVGDALTSNKRTHAHTHTHAHTDTRAKHPRAPPRACFHSDRDRSISPSSSASQATRVAGRDT